MVLRIVARNSCWCLIFDDRQPSYKPVSYCMDDRYPASDDILEFFIIEIEEIY